MPLELEFDVWSAYARASVRGKGTLGEFLDVLRRVAAMSSHAHPLLLLDLRELHGQEKMTEQMTAGMEAARHLGHSCRVAVIEPAFRVTFNGERAARRLGLDLRVFAAEDEPQAVSWLTMNSDSGGTVSAQNPDRSK